MAITPENAIPPEFARRLDVWRFRYWDHIDEYNDIFDLDELAWEAYRELRAERNEPPSTATPTTTGKAA